MSRLPSADVALPEAPAARRRFDRAADTFARASVVHDEARARLLARLDYLDIAPARILDLGCALGAGARELSARYGDACVLAVDSSLQMLRAAGADAASARVARIAAAAERLPLQNGSVDLILANMLLPWTRPQAVLAEAARLLSDGGLLLFATLGPDTLIEVRRAWAAVDDAVHVHAFFDMHDLGDLAVASGLAEPVLDVDRIELTYRDVDRMVEDLRGCGGTNVAGGRRRTLTGRRRWAGFEKALTAARNGDRFAVTVELVLGQAWGTGRAPRSRPTAPGEAAFAVADIGISRPGA